MKANKSNQGCVSYVRQEVISIPYQPVRKLFWSYAFHIPNIGNDGKTYKTRYEFRLESPSLSEFELEINNKDYEINPMVTLWICQGLHKLKSRIDCGDFVLSPLYSLIPTDSTLGLMKAVKEVSEFIKDMRESVRGTYSTYYSNSIGDSQ